MTDAVLNEHTTTACLRLTRLARTDERAIDYASRALRRGAEPAAVASSLHSYVLRSQSLELPAAKPRLAIAPPPAPYSVDPFLALDRIYEEWETERG